METRRRFLAALAVGCALGAAYPGPALGLDPGRRITQYRVRTWSLEDGLPQSTVLAIAQTGDGYLWLGTLDGLVRFDGVRFVGPEGWPGLPAAPISGLAVDGGGTLWVATEADLFYRGDGRFRAGRLDGEPVVGANVLVPREAGGIWIGRSRASLLVGDGDGRVWEPSASDGGPIEQVQALAERSGRLCFATPVELRCGREEPSEVAAEVAAEIARLTPSGSPPNALTIDAGGGIWVATLGGGAVRVLDGRVVRRIDRESGLESASVSSVFEDRDGNLWIADGTAGIARTHGSRLERSDRVRTVRAFFEDRDGNLWIGSNAGGLTRLTDGWVLPFSVPEGLPIPVAHVVLEAGDGTVWVGTEGGGLVAIREGSVAAVLGREDGLPGLDVMSLVEDRAGDLLVGTAGGVVRLHEGTFTPLPTDGAPQAFSLFEDSRGALWGGFLRELRRFDGERFRGVPWGSDTYVAAIAEGDDGTVWFGGNRGLLRWHQGSGHEVVGMGDAGSATVLSLLPDGPGLWVGTLGRGLGRWTPDGGFVALARDRGLCDDDVFSVLDDGRGHLWMSSNRGVFTVPVAEALDALAGEAPRVSCRLFGVADGMRQREASGATQPPAWRDAGGRLWFPTIDGVVRLDPVALLSERSPPPTLVEAVRPTPRDAAGDALVFPPDSRNLEIDYTALDLGAPEALGFRYRLTGLGEAWTEAGSRRTAYYPDLGPGRYRFEVAARSGDGAWGEAAVVPLTLEPRFVETRLFLGLVAGTLLLGAATGQRLYVARLRRRQRALEEAVRERTSELEAARADLELANATLEQRVRDGIAALRETDRMAAYGHLVAGVAHELRHPLFAVQTAAHLLSTKLGASEEVAEEIALLTQETGRIELLLEDLLELARPARPTLVPTDLESVLDEALASYEAAGAGDPEAALPVERIVEGELPAVPAEREKLVRMLLNLLNNARRHARASRLTVRAGTEAVEGEPFVRLTVADDGCGIPASRQAVLFEPFVSGGDGTGLGLAIVRRIVDAHRGTIRVRSEVGRGTEFVVELPAVGEPDGLARALHRDG